MSRYYRSILNVQGGAAIDPDAQAFLTATGIVDATITSAINNLVVSLKTDGLWAKMKAVYPFVGGTATTHKFNLKDPRDLNAAFRITWFGGVTHSANGVQGNGTNGYGNTHLNTSLALSLNNSSGFYRENIIGSVSGADFGAFIGGPNYGFQSNKFFSDQMFTRHNASTLGTSSATNISGFYGINRIAAASYNHYQNGTKTTISTSSVALPNAVIYLLAINASVAAVFTDRTFGSFYFGEGLTSGEQDNLNTIDTTFQTALGR